jgi:hypothetical protein
MSNPAPAHLLALDAMGRARDQLDTIAGLIYPSGDRKIAVVNARGLAALLRRIEHDLDDAIERYTPPLADEAEMDV